MIENTLPPLLKFVVARAPFVRLPLCFVWRFGERWNADKCPLIAAAMAFFGLLSIFPLLIAALAILGHTLRNRPDVMAQLRTFVASFFPGAAGEILAEIDAVAQLQNANALGVIAIASLLWSGRAYFDTLASVLNGIWPHAAPRSFWKHQIVLWSLVVGAGALGILSTASTVALQAAQTISERMPDFFINRQPALWNALGKAVAFALTTAMFWLIYRFVPHVTTRRRRRLIWGAALLGAASWEMAKWLFGRFIGHNLGHYRATYGGVAGVVLMLLWIYFSSIILLLGAQAAAVWEELGAESAPTGELHGTAE